ncbi:TetR/AcrR family transcriptional regulator [Modestobacter sp. SSW1-42]|uniref:TetR/AcrR family transcriptional regulator n=1 Tax=Modestobacter sp. SSW1-42 TaxID=596372 RepID=UPI0039866E3C
MTRSSAGGRTPSRAVEQALVDAAERVLVRDGLAGLTVRAVATEAGVAPMGVYNRFGNKDGLLAAVLARGFDGLAAATSEDQDVDPTARLRACGRNYRRFALAHPQHYAAMFGPGLSMAAPTEELIDRAGAAFTALVDRVRYGMDRGALRPGDPRETAQLIWSSVHGAVSLELSGVLQTADPAANYEALLQMLLDGLR